MAGTIAGCVWDRHDDPLLDDAELRRAIEGTWRAALRDVTLRIPGMPFEPADLETKVSRDAIWERALELILEERRLDEAARED